MQLLRIFKEHERGVVYRMGRLQGVVGPGPVLLLPFDQVITFDLRTHSIEVKERRLMTKDKATVFISSLIHYRIIDPLRYAHEVADPQKIIHDLVDTAIHKAIGDWELESLFERRSFFAAKLRENVNDTIAKYGMAADAVEVRDIIPSQSSNEHLKAKRALELERMSKLNMAEAEREVLLRRMSGHLDALKAISSTAKQHGVPLAPYSISELETTVSELNDALETIKRSTPHKVTRHNGLKKR